ncbi:Hypothetical predicted protein, partial [Paramuricea clavata]
IYERLNLVPCGIEEVNRVDGFTTFLMVLKASDTPFLMDDEKKNKFSEMLIQPFSNPKVGGARWLRQDLGKALGRLRRDSSSVERRGVRGGLVVTSSYKPEVTSWFWTSPGNAIAGKPEKGRGGPSGVDANGFKRILACKSFKHSSVALCDALATLARNLCTEYVDPSSIEALVASRLIPLDKGGGGVRPIGVGEVIRRVIGKSVMKVVKPDVMSASGSLQLCAGQPSG